MEKIGLVSNISTRGAYQPTANVHSLQKMPNEHDVNYGEKMMYELDALSSVLKGLVKKQDNKIELSTLANQNKNEIEAQSYEQKQNNMEILKKHPNGQIVVVKYDDGVVHVLNELGTLEKVVLENGEESICKHVDKATGIETFEFGDGSKRTYGFPRVYSKFYSQALGEEKAWKSHDYNMLLSETLPDGSSKKFDKKYGFLQETITSNGIKIEYYSNGQIKTINDGKRTIGFSEDGNPVRTISNEGNVEYSAS